VNNPEFHRTCKGKSRDSLEVANIQDFSNPVFWGVFRQEQAIMPSHISAFCIYPIFIQNLASNHDYK